MMIPITRKEKYINEIVGGGNTAPETPQTREELFFADILGEVVAPSPITRAEKYLAKIANKYSGELPEPVTRIERFLARAAGMDVTIPTPITREEIFWDNYSVAQKFEGVPPLTFKGNGKALKNYRIYGNTVNSESVGDRTANLFDGQLIDGYYTDNTLSSITGAFGIYQSCKISLPTGTYTIVFTEAVRIVRYIELEGTYLANPEGNRNVASYTFTLHDNNTVSLAFRNASNTTWDGTIKIQIVEGSESLPYEPYGYRVPVAINNYTVTLYLPESLKMVGDEAEYVDFVGQKQYFADGSYANVTLPEIPTIAGTNTLSVDTQVQPSKVYVEVGIKTGGYTIYFYNGETLLETVTGVPSGGTATYTGTTPTKESTQQYNYNFIGWNTDSSASTADAGAFKNVTANRSVYAIFEQVARGYTVYFYNGDALLQTVENVPEGGTATYTGATPTKDGFTFSGWQPSNVNITADTSCYAQFVEG